MFSYDQKLVSTVQIHAAPILSMCFVPPRDGRVVEDRYLFATSSHDRTARLTHISLASDVYLDREVNDATSSSSTTASLHLHTEPISSVTSDHLGAHLLTASWDGMIGLWDTTVPDKDEVPFDQAELNSEGSRKKRKFAQEERRLKRKAPISVLKAHTGRVSKALFARDDNHRAYSCGFDSTMRTWDVETGVCSNTAVSAKLSNAPSSWDVL